MKWPPLLIILAVLILVLVFIWLKCKQALTDKAGQSKEAPSNKKSRLKRDMLKFAQLRSNLMRHLSLKYPAEHNQQTQLNHLSLEDQLAEKYSLLKYHMPITETYYGLGTVHLFYQLLLINDRISQDLADSDYQAWSKPSLEYLNFISRQLLKDVLGYVEPVGYFRLVVQAFKLYGCAPAKNYQTVDRLPNLTDYVSAKNAFPDINWLNLYDHQLNETDSEPKRAEDLLIEIKILLGRNIPVLASLFWSCQDDDQGWLKKHHTCLLPILVLAYNDYRGYLTALTVNGQISLNYRDLLMHRADQPVFAEVLAVSSQRWPQTVNASWPNSSYQLLDL